MQELEDLKIFYTIKITYTNADLRMRKNNEMNKTYEAKVYFFIKKSLLE